MKIHEYNEMMSYLTRPAPKQVAGLMEEYYGKDQLKYQEAVKNGFQGTFEEYLQWMRKNAAHGGRIGFADGPPGKLIIEKPKTTTGFAGDRKLTDQQIKDLDPEYKGKLVDPKKKIVLGKVYTNLSGRYTAQNLFGYGRTADGKAFGIVKGSFAMKFYSSGYQELGLSGITPSTHSGLAASTAYTFNIAVDGGSVFADLAFTTDASNLNFGGNNGIISKIQAALDTQYYTAGNLFEKRVTVGIVGGDIRFTSGTRTRASAIALAAPTGGGTTPFGVGRLPAVTAVETVATELPDDTLSDKVYNTTKSNRGVFAYDDGKGNILGAATGTINYETGALNIQGPANAEFVVSFNYDSAHSGGITSSNILRTIAARSCNSKIDAEVEILGYV